MSTILFQKKYTFFDDVQKMHNGMNFLRFSRLKVLAVPVVLPLPYSVVRSMAAVNV